MAKLSPTQVKTGDAIKAKSNGRSDTVRAVSVILHLENGQDEVYPIDEKVEVLK